MSVRLTTELHALLVNRLHDMMQTVIDLFGFPTQVLRVLRHLQTTGSYTACVNRLTRRKEHAVVLEEMYRTRLAAHVTYLAAAPAAVRLQLLRVLFTQLVLECTRQRDVARHRPCFLSLREDALFRELVAHVLHLIAVRRTHDEHVINHLRRDTVLDGHNAVRSTDRNHLSAQLDGFLRRTPSYVSEARDSDRLAFDIFACLMQQVLCEIKCSVTCSLGTKDRTAPSHAFSGQHACVILARKLLIHTVQESDLATAYTYVTRRDILIRPDAAPELQHEGLAETHDLCVRLTYRVKIRTAFRPAHRQRRQGILECLLEAQELEHRRRHGAVETKTAFVRANGAVELHAVTQVGLHLTLIIDPRDAEREDAIGLDHALHDLRLLKFGVLIVHLFNRLQYLLNRL